jgi:bacterioferritin-associated ferredoxin
LARAVAAEVDDGLCRRPDVLKGLVAGAAPCAGVSDDDIDDIAPEAPSTGTTFSAARVGPLVLRRIRQALSALSKSAVSSIPSSRTAVASYVLDLILEATAASLRRVASGAAAMSPGIEAAVAVRNQAAYQRCREGIDELIQSAVAAIDNVLLPTLATPYMAYCRHDGASVAARAGLIESLRTLTEVISQCLVPTERVRYNTGSGGMSPSDSSDAVTVVLLELLEQAATAFECLLPHMAASMPRPDPAAGAPLTAECIALRPLLSAVNAVNTARGVLGLAPTPLLRDAANTYALTPIASTCAMCVIAMRAAASDASDFSGVDETTLVVDDRQLEFLVAAARCAQSFLDGADRRVLKGKGKPGEASTSCSQPQTQFQELLADIREFGLQAIAPTSSLAFLRTVAAVQQVLSIFELVPTSSPSTAVSVADASQPLWLRLPAYAFGGHGSSRDAQPMRSCVVTGPGDPLHVTMAYCMTSVTSVQVSVTVANRTPLCISQVLVDIAALPSASRCLRLLLAGLGSASGPLAFGASDASSPAANAQVSVTGPGQWAVTALSSRASATLHASFNLSVAAVHTGSNSSSVIRSGTEAALGGFVTRITASINAQGDVDTSSDPNRQRRRDADALLAYVRQRKTAKRNAAGAAASAVLVDASGFQSRTTHEVALHSLPPIGLALADLLRTPTSQGPDATRAACRWLRGFGCSQPATRVVPAVPLGLSADGCGDLDPRLVGRSIAASAACFAIAERCGLGEYADESRPETLFCAALAALPQQVQQCEPAGDGSRPAAAAVGAIVSIEVHRSGPEGASSAALAHAWLCVVRVPAAYADLSAAIASHSDFPALIRTILDAALATA